MIYLNIKICALEFSEKILLISQLPLMHNHHLHASNRILRPARHNFPRTLTNNLLSLSFALSLVIYYGAPLDAALINIKAICADRSLTNQWINDKNNRYFHNLSKFSTKNQKKFDWESNKSSSFRVSDAQSLWWSISLRVWLTQCIFLEIFTLISVGCARSQQYYQLKWLRAPKNDQRPQTQSRDKWKH